MDREELIRKYAGGERDFTGENFRGVHWNDRVDKGIIYQQADFSNSYFDLSGFIGCDLSFSKFLYTRMDESGFADCYMPGADFTYATFSQCNFIEGVDLRSAIFRNTTLSEVNFKGANLAYADLRGARKFDSCFCRGTIFYETIMPDGSVRTDSI